MPRKPTSDEAYHPEKVRGNFGPGGFSDQYDNSKMKSMDRDQHPGGVTGIPYEDKFDFELNNFRPHKGEAWHFRHTGHEPDRDADLGLGPSGTNWNYNLNQRREDFSGRGPKGWKLTDEKLKERVSEVLLHSHEVDPSEMEVIVEDRVVYLKGNIRSRGMKVVAEDLIMSVPGVEDVFTELKIKETSNFQFRSSEIEDRS